MAASMVQPLLFQCTTIFDNTFVNSSFSDIGAYSVSYLCNVIDYGTQILVTNL